MEKHLTFLFVCLFIFSGNKIEANGNAVSWKILFFLDILYSLDEKQCSKINSVNGFVLKLTGSCSKRSGKGTKEGTKHFCFAFIVINASNDNLLTDEFLSDCKKDYIKGLKHGVYCVTVVLHFIYLNSGFKKKFVADVSTLPCYLYSIYLYFTQLKSCWDVTHKLDEWCLNSSETRIKSVLTYLFLQGLTSNPAVTKCAPETSQETVRLPTPHPEQLLFQFVQECVIAVS